MVMLAAAEALRQPQLQTRGCWAHRRWLCRRLACFLPHSPQQHVDCLLMAAWLLPFSMDGSSSLLGFRDSSSSFSGMATTTVALMDGNSFGLRGQQLRLIWPSGMVTPPPPAFSLGSAVPPTLSPSAAREGGTAGSLTACNCPPPKKMLRGVSTLSQ
ncbi:UNVERIFIED_CONTAM: hypothetical protein FKN15_051701 [Acipenser sinensis]